MSIGSSVLSEFVEYDKYAHYMPSIKRREGWGAIVKRYLSHLKSYYPSISLEIDAFGAFIRAKKVLPSMRLLQTAGIGAKKQPVRGYNCTFRQITSSESICDCFYTLLCGCGVGYSVQNRHVCDLPRCRKPEKEMRHLVADTIEGWAEALLELLYAYMQGDYPSQFAYRPIFDYQEIRRKGSRIHGSNGLAPGYKPLKKALEAVEEILIGAIGRKLSSFEVHEILCLCADAVVAGGVRRSAMICLFDRWDEEILNCKTGEWWKTKPHLGKANNSIVLNRSDTSEEEFKELWTMISTTKTGDPGFYWTNDTDMGTNPCGEAALKDGEFCNLTTINLTNLQSQEDLCDRAEAAAFFGTLQAGLTDFHYVDVTVKEATEKARLIGVSGCGWAGLSPEEWSWIPAAVSCVDGTNRNWSERIGIGMAHRMTMVKPEGTASKLLGTNAAGVHHWYAPYMIQRVEIAKHLPVYQYLLEKCPDLIEDKNGYEETTALFSIPLKAPDGVKTKKDVGAVEFCELVKRVYLNWVAPGYRKGANNHSVSATVNVKDDEWEELGNWCWKHRDYYAGLSFMPDYGGTHPQMPWQEITKEKWEEMETYLMNHCPKFYEIVEERDGTSFVGEISCHGGSCEE